MTVLYVYPCYVRCQHGWFYVTDVTEVDIYRPCILGDTGIVVVVVGSGSSSGSGSGSGSGSSSSSYLFIHI